MDPVDTVLMLDTPERVRFRFRLAGPFPRAVAWAVDGFLKSVVVFGMAVLFLILSFDPTLFGLGTGAFLMALFALEWGYGAGFEWLNGGRTPGKMVVGLRVVRADGGPPSAGACVLRNLLRSADLLGMGTVGLLCSALDPQFRRFGDLAAGTVVLHDARAKPPAAVELEPPISEEERLSLPPRVELEPEHLQVVEAFLARRKVLSHGRIDELARMIGPSLERAFRVTAPDPTRAVVLAWARATGRDRA